MQQEYRLASVDFFACTVFIFLIFSQTVVPGDKSALNPSGLRFGTPPITTRGIKENDIVRIVDYVDKAFELAVEIQQVSGPKLVDWKKTLETNDKFKAKVQALKEEVEAFAGGFPLPGHQVF